MSSASLVEMETDQQKTSQSVKWVDLLPNRALLDSNFEGYKLSLDSFIQYKLEMSQNLKLDTYNFIESSDSKQKFLLYQHLKLFGMQNLLIFNKFDDSNLYYFDTSRRLIRVVYNLPKLVPQRALVPTNLVLPNQTNSERTLVTMKFLNESTACIFDGYDTIYVCQIDQNTKSENPLEPENWNILLRHQLTGTETTCILKDALLYDGIIHALLLNVVESTDKINNTNKFDTIINWLSFENNNLKRVRKINCFTAVPEYVSLETNGKSVYLAGPSFSKYVYDSEVKIDQKKADDLTKKPSVSQMETDQVANFSEKFYTWNQTPEEVVIKICLDMHKKGENVKVTKSDINLVLRTDSIEIVFMGQLVLQGHFSSNIKLDESFWNLNNTENSDYIDLNLTKAKHGEVWPYFLKDLDKYGEYKVDENQTFLNQYTSETLAKSSESKSLFALEQQLEECDGITDDQTMSNVENEELFLMLRRLDGETHQETHKCYINDNKFLFEIYLSKNKNPALCLRHDVDGILWQPHRVSAPSSPDTILLTHEHTFLAFGYVQASKQEAKFRSSPPDCSYVSIIDTKRHIYVYKQDSEKVETQLKNRKTGKLITHVAKQYLITLDNDSEIYGVYCSNDFMVVLLKDFCYIYKINPSI